MQTDIPIKAYDAGFQPGGNCAFESTRQGAVGQDVFMKA
jgi:hypothetical protein